MIKIYPTLISEKIQDLKDQINLLEPFCQGFHIDIQDLQFAPNLKLVPTIISEIKRITTKQLWLHLLVDDPRNWLQILNLQDNDILSFHFESLFRDPTSIKFYRTKGFIGQALNKEYIKIIDEIHKKKWLASIALNLDTPASDIFDILPFVDQVLLLSTQAGHSDEKSIPKILDKIKEISQFKINNNLNFNIAIQGGVNQTNIKQLLDLNVQDFAVEATVFKNNAINTIQELNKLINS